MAEILDKVLPLPVCGDTLKRPHALGEAVTAEFQTDANLAMHRMNRAVYEAKHREHLERDHLGKHVLMHDGEVVDMFDDLASAYKIGVEQFGVEQFSIIEVGLTLELGSLQHLIS